MAKYRFDEIAINSTEKKKPTEEDKYVYVGLEHLDPECLQVTHYGSEVAPIGEKLVMKEGDVLFGKRRAYQRKVAIAPFDGIFSAHGMVLRPRTEIISKELFPFFISSNQFLDAAIQISVGSLSPTINWRDLAELEFSLPPIDEQSKLAELLWAFERTKESYKRLLAKTDELVYAQFVEMFGDVLTNSMGWDFEPLSNIATIVTGTTPKTGNADYWDGNIKWITPAELSDDSYIITDSVRHITESGVRNAGLTPFPGGTVILSSRAPIGKTAIAGCEMYCNQGFKNLICSERLAPTYLFSILKLNTDYLNSLGRGATFKEITKSIVGNIYISVPPIELQNRYTEFYKSNYESKLSILQSQKSLDICRNALMEKVFG